MKNDDWLAEYFDSGFYEHYWGWQIQEEDEDQLAEDALKLLGASSGHILDWCGGWGRVSINFARKGFKVTILDFTKGYLEAAKVHFAAETLDLEVVEADCRGEYSSIQADYATCFFNTVGFFNDLEQVKAFRSLYRALKPKGKFIVDSMNLLYLAPLLKPIYDTRRSDGYLFRQNNVFDFDTNTLDSIFEIIKPDGKVKATKEFHQRLFTPGDLVKVIETAGFRVQGVFGNYKGDPVASVTPQIVVVASK